MAKIEMTIDSIRVSLTNYQRVVMLKEKTAERYLPIWIGPAEADAIAIKIEKMKVPRPLTHDFVSHIIRNLGATVKSAIINELKKDTFRAKIVLTKGNEVSEIDCRPSDAIATALTTGAPIFADEKVLKKVGVIYSEVEGISRIESTNRNSKYDIFSDSAQQIMILAEEEAKRLNHTFVGTGHILIALIKCCPSILDNMGVDTEGIIVQIEEEVKQHLSLENAESGLTSSAEATVKLSIEEAKKLGSNKVEAEHILLGLMGQAGIANKILKDHRVDKSQVYVGIIQSYNQQGYWQQEPPELHIRNQ